MKTRTDTYCTISAETQKRERTDSLDVEAQPLWRVEVRQPDGSDLSKPDAVRAAREALPDPDWHVWAIERRNYDRCVVTFAR